MFTVWLASWQTLLDVYNEFFKGQKCKFLQKHTQRQIIDDDSFQNVGFLLFLSTKTCMGTF